MNNRLILIGLVLTIVLGCTNKKPLKIISKSFAENDIAACKEVNCPEITINYFETTGEAAVSKKINDSIHQWIINSLYIGDPNNKSTAKNITEAAQGFIKAYRHDNAAYPDMAAEYEAQLTITPILVTEEILSVELKQYNYTGGAHGYGSSTFHNFDVETGESVPLDALFSNPEGFKKLAEGHFRKKHDIPTDETINATGLWFKNDVFYLPNSIGFTKKNVLLVYNPYEIASYAQGVFEVKIPIEEAAEFLSVSIPE